jgi:hypothetical protein
MHRSSVIQNVWVPGDQARDGSRSELAAVRADFNRIVKLHVDAPARERGYLKNGLHWTKETDEIHQLMGLHQHRERKAIRFGIDLVITVRATEVFTGGMGLVGVPLGQSDGFAEPPKFADTRLGWCVDADGLAGFAMDRPARIGSVRRRVPLDEIEFESIVREQVLPFLDQFTTVGDALAYTKDVAARFQASAEALNLPPSLRKPPGTWKPLVVMEAMAAWRAAGSPVAPVTVTRLDDNRLRVEFDDPTSLVGNEDDDLARASVERSTQQQYETSVTQIERVGDRVLIVHGDGLDPETLQTNYSAYLSVVRFASELPDPPKVPLPGWYFEGLAPRIGKREPSFDVDADEDGDLLIRFSDDIAGEDPGAIDECAEATSGFGWITSAAHEDREVLRLEVGDHTANDLRALKARFRSIIRERS